MELSDTLLWWVAGGVDAISLIAKAVENGSTSPDDIIKYWNSVKKFPAISATTPGRRPNTTAIQGTMW